MSAPEFTGERVIPGLVDTDLWNEHIARYAFASRLARRKRVLDAGCGAGYGAAILSHTAASVIAFDVSTQAIDYARQNYPAPRFLTAGANALPFKDASFDLLTAFELIEHIPDWAGLIRESARVLAPGGEFIVSTPNIHYYAETRRQSGPNRFHEHEFEFEEFESELRKVYPHVSFFLQNHAAALVFQPIEPATAAEVKLESATATPAESHFFVAVCAQGAQTGSPAFVYIPSSANVLREREQHIEKLEGEVAKKTKWLEEATDEHVRLLAEHRQLVDMFRAQAEDIDRANRWAQDLNVALEASNNRVVQLQEEVATEQAAAAANVAAYESKVQELERDNETKTTWAQETNRKLEEKCDELARCVDILHSVEADLEERTTWAAAVEARRAELERLLTDAEAQIGMARTSRWVRLGRTLGIGPELRTRS